MGVDQLLVAAHLVGRPAGRLPNGLLVPRVPRGRLAGSRGAACLPVPAPVPVTRGGVARRRAAADHGEQAASGAAGAASSASEQRRLSPAAASAGSRSGCAAGGRRARR